MSTNCFSSIATEWSPGTRPTAIVPTVIEASLEVRAGSVLHQHALGLLRVERHLGRLGTHQPHKLGRVLVLLPVAGGQVVVGVGGVEVEALVLWGRGLLRVACGGLQGPEDFNL